MSPDRRIGQNPEAQESLGAHERELHRIIDKYEVPLLRKAWNTWSEQTLANGQKRGWLVCGPTTIALSRIINCEAGIPLLRNGNPNTEEHLKLQSYLFYPKDKPDDKVEHIVLQYFDGQEQVTHIDVTGQFLLEGGKELTGDDDLRGAIHRRTFSVSEYNDVLTDIYKLYPFDPDSKHVKDVYNKYKLPPPNVTEEADWAIANYDDRVTSPFPLKGDSCREIILYAGNDRYGPPLADFIRGFIPDWTGVR
jgi:hypothetical protein